MAGICDKMYNCRPDNLYAIAFTEKHRCRNSGVKLYIITISFCEQIKTLILRNLNITKVNIYSFSQLFLFLYILEQMSVQGKSMLYFSCGPLFLSTKYSHL